MFRLTLFSLGVLSNVVNGPFLFVDGLPPGFIAEVVTSINAVTGAFAPNPRNGQKPMLLLVHKDGEVSVVEDPDNSPDSFQILDLDGHMCTDTERGLQTIAVHPKFGTDNHYIYLFYNSFREDCLADKSDGGPWNVVDRFEMDPETLLLDFERREEIWRGAPLPDSVHNGGALVFGNDDKLYIAVGEGGEPDNAQDLRNLHGCLIRVNDDGTIPDDNPFTTANGYEAYPCVQTSGKIPENASENGVCAEIYANGLRNPFRMSLDPNEKTATRMAISDVGGKVWEELNWAGTDWAGANYGHKTYEGPCLRHTTDDCPISEEFTDPFYFYQHHVENDGCVAGSVFVPEGIWPDEYKLLFIDFVFYVIYNLIEAPEQECRTCIPPVPRYRNETFYKSIQYPGEGKNEARMLDLFFGPYQDTEALYVVKFGNHDTVLRIRYTGINNQPAVVDFAFDERNYDVGEEVQFDGSLTSDAEGDDLTFEWFFGDGETSFEVSPTHIYHSPGEYEVTLIVTDPLDQEQQKSAFVFVGDPPSVNILSPLFGDKFYVGQVFTVEGEAFHANGNQFNDMELEWEVRKHHDDHYHPFLDPINGNFLELPPAPEPEDFYASLSSYLEIILRVTDKDGLSAESSVLLQPFLITVTVDTYPMGLEVVVDDEPILGFNEVWSWSGHELHLKAEDQSPYVFVSWSDGLTSTERAVMLNDTNLSFVANFCVEEGGPCEMGSDRCCNASCNANGKCGDDHVEEEFILTPEPEQMESTAAPADNPASSEGEVVTNEEVDSGASSIVTPQESEKGMSSAKEAMLVIVVLVLVACIGLFVFHKRDRRSIRRVTKTASKSNFVDVEKIMLSTDNDGQNSSDDGHTIQQTPSC